MAADDRRLDAELEATQLEKEYQEAYSKASIQERRAHLICLTDTIGTNNEK
jgi:hypothetical protein